MLIHFGALPLAANALISVLHKVLKGRLVKAQGEMKCNPVEILMDYHNYRIPLHSIPACGRQAMLIHIGAFPLAANSLISVHPKVLKGRPVKALGEMKCNPVS
jgi:hypothetical protein